MALKEGVQTGEGLREGPWGFGEGDEEGGPDGNVALQYEGLSLQSPLKETLNKVLRNSSGPLERICAASGCLLCRDSPRGLLYCG